MDFIELSRFEFVFVFVEVLGAESERAIMGSISVAENDRFRDGERKELGDKEGR